MPAECVANSIADGVRCVVRGEHLSNCDGHARRFEEVEEYDKRRRRTTRWFRTVILDRPCGGCLPRPVYNGTAFCEFHTRQAEAAVSVLADTLTHLWSVNGGAPRVADTVRSGFGSRWTLTDSRIRANEIAEHTLALALAYAQHSAEPMPQPRDVVSPFFGFRSTATTYEVAAVGAALQNWLGAAGSDLWKLRHTAARMLPFIAAVRSAFLRFPSQDDAHRVPVLRCRKCGQLALTWHPPLFYLDDDTIACDRCGAVEDRALIEHDIAVILEVKGRKRA